MKLYINTVLEECVRCPRAFQEDRRGHHQWRFLSVASVEEKLKHTSQISSVFLGCCPQHSPLILMNKIRLKSEQSEEAVKVRTSRNAVDVDGSEVGVDGISLDEENLMEINGETLD